eukprot:TRINITY_DN27630_c0_g1_i1.p1 TRINITY_DN27630_c0_g1~~TRINITY_DN27630_c0_g1_i1.p1  ORF type:complete len:271 (+),score=60.42 TRINITY_DN27630_c0_g1_i1:48-860(+)
MGGRKRKRAEAEVAGPGGDQLPFRWKRPRRGAGAGSFDDDDETWAGPFLRLVVATPSDCTAAGNAALLAQIKRRLDDALGEEQAVFPHPQAVMVIGVWTAGGTEVVAGVVVCERLQQAWRMVDKKRGEREVGAIQHIVESGLEVTADTLARGLSAGSSASPLSSVPDTGAESPNTTATAPKALDELWARQSHVESLVDAGQGCICGVSRIWVDPTLRRQGIASALLDKARAALVFGYDIPKEQTAFSQPTAAGKLLARSYSARDDFYMYT